MSEAPLGRWYGVTTDADGRVVELDLHDNNLSGTIPYELERLANLRRLWLEENNLSGAIPPELGQLANLEALWLTANNLSGAIPSELGQLVNLQELELTGNNLSGCVPPRLWDIPKNDLAKLDLDGCAPTPTSTPVPVPRDDPDRAALIALYNATDGPNWEYGTNWLSDTPLSPCTE